MTGILSAPSCNSYVNQLAIASDILVGTICKNGGCGQAYESPATNLAACVHHPGVPVFHEGLKYWSCCTKRTSDFAAFLAQRGCTSGQHKWLKTVSAHSGGENCTQCTRVINVPPAGRRFDRLAAVPLRLAPDRPNGRAGHLRQNVPLCRQLRQGRSGAAVRQSRVSAAERRSVQHGPGAARGECTCPNGRIALGTERPANCTVFCVQIIDVAATKVQFYGTKVEVTMVKAEPGQWVKFEVPQKSALPAAAAAVAAAAAAAAAATNGNEDDGIESDVDLDDIEAIRAVTISDQAADDAGLDFD